MTEAGAPSKAMRAAIRWIVFCAALGLAPVIWPGPAALGILTQIATAVIACLAYNVLLGQGGMLSFGHAVYSGLGSYAAIHALRLIDAGTFVLPVSAVPLAAGAGGLLAAALLGYVTTRRSGTALAMITLGLGELMMALSVLWPAVFGGEGGISANRVTGPAWAGLTFAPARQLYGLAAVYCLASTAALYAFTQTPLGCLLNAVRDNPVRAGFIGCDPRRVRYRAFLVSGFFMGVSGGLSALQYEIMQAEVMAPARSTALLLFVFLGGTRHFCGPIIGAVLMVLALGSLSQLTPAWPLYLGLAFVLMVLWAREGLAGLLESLWRAAVERRLRWHDAAMGLGGAVMLAALVALIETLYRLRFQAAADLRFQEWPLDAARGRSCAVLAALAMLGGALLAWGRRRR